MAYDNPLTISYSFPALNFATTPAASAIRRPRGYTKARIESVHVSVTTLFTAVTLSGHVRLGIVGTLGKYADLTIGAAAATDAVGTLDSNAITAAGRQIDMSAQGDNISQIEVTFDAPTGGTPAGAGTVTVTVSWYK